MVKGGFGVMMRFRLDKGGERQLHRSNFYWYFD